MSIAVWVLEGIVIAVFFSAVIICYKRGLLASIISLLGYLIACVGAFIGSKALAETIYRMFLHDRLVGEIKSAIAERLPGALVEDYTGFAELSPESLMGSVPEVFRKLVTKGLDGVNLPDFLSGSLMGTSEQIVEQLVYPAALAILQSILFFVLFIALLIVVKIAVKFFKNANKLPVIGPINALLGGAVGFAEAFVIMLLLTFFLKMLFAAGVEFSFLTQADIDSTTLFSAFYYRRVGELASLLTV